MPRIFIFGNPLLEEDSIPLRIASRLRKAFPKLDIKEMDPTEDLRMLGRDPLIIDTVMGPKDVVVLRGLDSIEDSPRCSLHDLDLGMSLKIMKKTGMIDSVSIIGIPSSMEEDRAFEGVRKAIKALRL